MKSLFIAACTVLMTGSITAQATDPGFEVQNKSDTIFVKIKNDDKFVTTVKAEKEKTASFNIDTRKETVLYIYKSNPTDPSIAPFRVYKIKVGKTIYVTWNNDSLYPETGPMKGLTGNTKTGYSLKNNVVIDLKKGIHDIKDITDLIRAEGLAEVAMAQAAKEKEKEQDLNALWHKWCDSTGDNVPEHPNSVFCAAGYGNSVALLMMRLRFTRPENKGCTDSQAVFSPKTHALKMVGDYLPEPPKDQEKTALTLNAKELYSGFFKEIDEDKGIEWKDFNKFLDVVTSNPALVKWLAGVMEVYGLATESTDSAAHRKKLAQDIRTAATKALSGWFSSAPSFPNALADGKYMTLNERYETKCRNGGAWQKSLLCAMGEGNTSATYFGRFSFVKPPAAKNHLIMMVKEAVANWAKGQEGCPGWITDAAKTGAVYGFTRQLGEALHRVTKGEVLTWEELRNAAVLLKKNWADSIPGYTNGAIKAYGLEIAP